MKGLEILGISPSRLLVEYWKVTAKRKLTGSSYREKLMTLAIEPSNPVQLSLFQWSNGQATGCSELLVTASAQRVSKSISVFYISYGSATRPGKERRNSNS